MPTVNYGYSAGFNPATYRPVFDPTGVLPANKVTGEIHTLTAANGRDFHFLVPLFGPFFAAGASLVFKPASGPARTLVEGVDFNWVFRFVGASYACAKPVYGGIGLLDNTLAGTVTLVYQSIGGTWTINQAEINRILAETILNPRVVAWEQVVNRPLTFPVIDHEWNLDDMVGAKEVVEEIKAISLAISTRPAGGDNIAFQAHIDDLENPHEVTKEHVGLEKVENFPVATQLESESGLLDNRYMTPQRTKQAIDALAVITVAGKSGEVELEKADVGLNLVENLAVVTVEEIDAKAPVHKYVTHELMLRHLDNLDIVPGYSITPSSTSINEGASLTYAIDTVNVIDGTTIYWSLSGIGIDAGDFSAPSLTGQLIVNSAAASVVKVLANDTVTEGMETLVFTLRTKSLSGPVVAVNSAVKINDTSILGTYTLVANKTAVSEGETITFTVTSTNVPNGTAVYWRATGTGITGADFSDGLDSGSLVINGNSGSFTRTLAADALTEGTESFVVTLRALSAAGAVLATSDTIVVTDSSKTGVYAVAPTSTSVNEGAAIAWTVSTTNVPNGTVLFWKLTGTVAAADFSGNSLTGSSTVNNNAASISLTALSDAITEGAETVTLTLRTGSQTGTVVATSVPVTINDTSKWPVVGTLLSTSCSGTTLVSNYADGSGGSTSSNTANSASCGYVPPPAYGTLISTYCTGTYTKMGTYANGTGGTYSDIIEANSVSCGYVAPSYPAAGTKLSQACTGTTLVGTYANGTGGSYNSNIETNSATCGYVAPVAYGTLISYYCSGTTLMANYANGNYGSYTGIVSYNSTNCGYVAPSYPAAGTKLNEFCTGTTLMGTYANGSGGSTTAAIATNSTTCGYVAPPVYPASGTKLSEACSGTTLVGTYANGTGGTYNANIATNSPTCGYVAPPAYGTLLSQACSGTTLVGTYANGTGGSYTANIATNSTTCGYVAPRFYSFGSSGKFTVPAGVSAMTVLIVAGGGGGSSSYNTSLDEGGGGGGAGGVVYQTAYVTPGQTYSVVVGAGGGAGTNGSNSSFSNLVAIGGGSGAYRTTSVYVPEASGTDANGLYFYTPAHWEDVIKTTGADGGSGGGGHGHYYGVGGAGTPGQGNAGGNGVIGASGGGGGCAAAGSGNNGGSGKTFYLGAYALTVGGGGSGGGVRGAPGAGGGGTGAYANGNGGNGAGNTGGGGGGAGREDGGGGVGGSGGAGGVWIYIPGTNG